MNHENLLWVLGGTLRHLTMDTLVESLQKWVIFQKKIKLSAAGDFIFYHKKQNQGFHLVIYGDLELLWMVEL